MDTIVHVVVFNLMPVSLRGVVLKEHRKQETEVQGIKCNVKPFFFFFWGGGGGLGVNYGVFYSSSINNISISIHICSEKFQSNP